MKKFAMFALCSLGMMLASGVSAQTPDIQDFTVNGIRVVMRPSANQVVAALVAFNGGYGYGETNNPYSSSALLDVTTASGSAKYPKDQFRALTERMVTTIGGTGNYYSILYSLRCVKPHFDKSWDMFSDVILHPLYDSIEWKNTRDNELNEINDRRSSPDNWAYFAGDSIYRSSNARFGRTVEDTRRDRDHAYRTETTARRDAAAPAHARHRRRERQPRRNHKEVAGVCGAAGRCARIDAG